MMMAVLSITCSSASLLAQSSSCRAETVILWHRRPRVSGIAYYAVQAATMLILVLAAGTAYADFRG